jgi:hypothetical protein
MSVIRVVVIIDVALDTRLWHDFVDTQECRAGEPLESTFVYTRVNNTFEIFPPCHKQNHGVLQACMHALTSCWNTQDGA